jgi:hypothetical protein
MAADEPAARTPARENFRNEVLPGVQLPAAVPSTNEFEMYPIGLALLARARARLTGAYDTAVFSGSRLAPIGTGGQSRASGPVMLAMPRQRMEPEQ